MDISIIGAGHVGLVTGACFADLGNRVLMVDHDRGRIATLKRGRLPFYEPGLEELVRSGLSKKRIVFSTSVKDAVRDGRVIFICVGTPSRPTGDADLSSVEHVCREIGQALRGYRLIVEKSTVPVETGEWIKRTMRAAVSRHVRFDVASNPEFLREGSAIHDFLHPDRIVLGVETARARVLLLELYKSLKAPVLVTDVKSAELIKHASNSFLALKISFINAVARICDLVGANVVEVAEGMGLDPRIGRAFLDAGVGYGGSCFPKDVAAFIRIAEKLGYDFQLLKATARVNEEQCAHVVKQVSETLWNLSNKTIGVLGLAFKPETDDVREAPSIRIIQMLQQEGAKVRAFDPKAMGHADSLFRQVTFCKDAYDAARGADCLLVITEWNEFKELDFARVKKLMRHPAIIDGRNIYDPEALRRLGFRYVGTGRRDASTTR